MQERPKKCRKRFIVSLNGEARVLRDFGKVLKPSKSNHIPQPKAPFSKLGEDGFEDVDHQGLDAEIKSLALTLKKYLELTRPLSQYLL